jgi:indolepyruvate ferredoxin oxidoreductase beta subunit
METKNILIVGVGGQGTLLSSRVLGRIAQDLGFDVKLSEVHGMAQRGGSVVTHVRYGDKVYSPVIDQGQADIIIAFEILEAMRYLGFLKKGGRMFVNCQEILPMPVITGAAKYPQDLRQTIRMAAPDTVFIDALALAQQAGSVKAVNTVLLGVLAKNTDIPKENYIDAIKNTIAPKFLELNLRAFELGIKAVGEEQ